MRRFVSRGNCVGRSRCIVEKCKKLSMREGEGMINVDLFRRLFCTGCDEDGAWRQARSVCEDIGRCVAGNADGRCGFHRM